MVALSESAKTNLLKRPLAEKSRWRHIRLAIKSRYLGNHASQIKSYYRTLSVFMVALSESLIKNRAKRPLAAKSRWCHIRLSIKPRYLANHESQINSYYGTLRGSHGRSFRIHHENCLKRPQVAKSRWRDILFVMKACYHALQIKKLLWITIRKSWSLSDFHKKTANINSKNWSVYKCC